MSDATATEDDADEPPSPTPAPRNVRPGSSSFGLFLDDSEPENPPSKIPQRGVKARGVAPLVSGLEGLGLESSSRRVLFPTATVHALEAAPEISPHQHQGGEVQIDGEIPIDPMLLDAPEEEEEDIDGEYETEDNYVDVTTTIPTAPAAEYTNLYTIQKSILHTTPILAGAVVFIDVLPLPRSHHLSETLSALGAKTVEKWDWEARGGKVGITHVVFEEGSLGTLRKVTESQGLVVCVAGGWVEECSRRRMWIDEALFAVEWDGCMDVVCTLHSP